jgi:flagellar hook-associated protein 1
MSLLSSIHMANNALLATQIGLQVTGQNIANVNTPGYAREEVILTPAPTQRVGQLTLGLGVDVAGVVQKIDRFLEERVRGATSDRANSAAQQQAFQELEGVLSELTDSDLSSSLSRFFASIHEVLNQPESVATRNLAVLQGRNLATDVSRLSNRVGDLRSDYNQQIVGAAKDINRLVENIRTLNVQISTAEAGDLSESDAVGLRDQRSKALADLSELIGIRTEEQPSGEVNVFIEGDFLVFGSHARQVRVRNSSDRGVIVSSIEMVETGSPLVATSGKVAGLQAARDAILGGFREQLDEFAQTLIFEFNRLFSSGQGLKGYRQTESESAVDALDAALDSAGLPFVPVNGSFQVQVFNRRTGQTTTTDVLVPLNGLDGDATLASLTAALDGVDGVSAAVLPTRKLRIASDSSDLEFAFSNDTSGVLAALGIGTFFSGTTAAEMGVRQALIDDPALFAASRGGIGADTSNALALAEFVDRPLESAAGTTLNVLHDRLVGGIAQASAAATATSQGLASFEQSLLGQHLAATGVNLDEEVVRLLNYQRAYQVAAKFIASISELLDLLVKL